jgi:ABC-type uncharacterized transport system substrate-binding protein
MTLRFKVSEAATQTLGIKVEALGVRSTEDFEPALTAMAKPDAIFVVDDRRTSILEMCSVTAMKVLRGVFLRQSVTDSAMAYRSPCAVRLLLTS